MHEKFYAKPGEVQSATDSHTTTYGGAGCFCSGIGTAEMAAALTTGELWFKVPSAIKVVLNGHFPKGVFSKDIILRILGDITASGAQYKSLEFTGPAAREMSLDARFTVANMALEAGAKCGLFEADEKTAAYYGIPLSEIDWIRIDDEAQYEKVLTYDVSTLEPQLSCPQGVDNVYPISEVLGTPMDEVYIGSCTNGSLEDLKAAADILRGKKLPTMFVSLSCRQRIRSLKKPLKKAISRTLLKRAASFPIPAAVFVAACPMGSCMTMKGSF